MRSKRALAHCERALARYTECWRRHYPNSELIVGKFRALMNLPHCFSRDCYPGHITASALVVDRHYRTLLTYHAKLNKWLQLGGHCDGVADPHLTAIREVKEESGLQKIADLHWQSVQDDDIPIFDLDIHAIPARKTEPEHFHYDVRYLFMASDPDSIQLSSESRDLKWFSFEEARQITPEVSMTRLFDKFEQVMLK